jgi:hypothetical protein
MQFFAYVDTTNTNTIDFAMATNGDSTQYWRSGSIGTQSYGGYEITAAPDGYSPLVPWS